jgi:hypothetical protein
MKRLSGPRKTANLSESVQQRLSMYALAAGVGSVALSVPCEARIIHRNIDVFVEGNSYYEFNPANQAAAPFILSASFLNRTYIWWNVGFFAPLVQQQDTGALIAKNALVADLKKGAVVGKKGVFGKGFDYGALFTYGPYGGGTYKHHNGNFPFGRPDYIGFKFYTGAKAHFGWLKVKIGLDGRVTYIHAIDYAYETIGGKSIRTGQTKETNDAFDAQIEDTPGTTSLGILALGARGVPLWRRKESAVTASEDN